MLDAANLPDDITALKAMLIAAKAREVRKDERIERLEKLVAAFKQAAFGRKSEKADPKQIDLALEDLETASLRSMLKTKPITSRVSHIPNHASPIAALFPPIFLVSRRSSSRKA